MKLVKRAVLLYGNTKKYHADIFEHDILYGSGDYEDPPEIANDREVTCYYIWYQDLIGPKRYCAGGYASVALEDVIDYLEKLDYFSHWVEIPADEIGMIKDGY